MNRNRCPWCGKIIDKKKDKIYLRDVVLNPSVPRLLRTANCGHCGHKYGQVPFSSQILKICAVALLVVVFAVILESVFLFFLAFCSCFLLCFTPYCKLNDEAKPYEEAADLFCKMILLEKYQKLKPYNLYFLNNRFDDFEPFSLVSPIHVYAITSKNNIVLGEFIYKHEINDTYMEQESCELYDTEMNLVAKIKFVTAAETTK